MPSTVKEGEVFIVNNHINGNFVFTLPDTETEKDTDTDEICTKLNGKWCSCPSLRSLSPFFINLGVCFGVGQCEHTITRYELG